jgi:choline dehydrogenase-like flavoprotein
MMHAMHAPDPTAITGKKLAIAAHWPCVVIGAGNSGIAAATEAARAGAKVLLVDEHPSPPGLLGLDIPYLFGGRLDASVQNAGRMLETVLAARPGLEAAMDSGVEVALGTCVWPAAPCPRPSLACRTIRAPGSFRPSASWWPRARATWRCPSRTGRCRA